MAQPQQQQQQQPQIQPQGIMQNRNALIAMAGGGLVLAIVLIIAVMSSMGGSKGEAARSPVIKEEVTILTTDDIGKTLEIEALLAKEGIHIRKDKQGTKTEIILSPKDGITEDEKDRAIISIVKSGLIDKNVGLEIFDKGDFTSSREDKKIRLSRAVNGELARLIKRLPNIKDASVFISLPKDTIFTSLKQPTTATVQLVVDPSQDKLEKNIVKAIINLLMGSVDDLLAENISITDTNGNVYSSVEDISANMLDMVQEKDSYMKRKIDTQLDRLLGKGNYIVTVSTYLREVPVETSKVAYSPDESTVGNKQKFTENLGDNSHDKSKISNAVSSYLPGGLPVPESSQKRNYSRNAEEYNYKVGQIQTSEFKKTGILEEITIAITVNKGTMPADMSLQQLKELIARTANPKAKAENVEIAFADNINPYLATERPVQRPEPESSGNPWWTVAALIAGAMFIGLVFISGRAKDASSKQQKEIDKLLEKTTQQERALQETYQIANQLQNNQQQIYQTISAQQAIQQQQQQHAAIPDINGTIQEIRDDIDEDIDEEEFATTLKSWIESS